MARALPPHHNVYSSNRWTQRTTTAAGRQTTFIPYVALDIENNDDHDWRPQCAAWYRLLANAGRCLSPGWDTTPEEITVAVKPKKKKDTDRTGSGRRRGLSSASSPPIHRPSPSSGGRRLQTVRQQLTPSNDNRTTRRISPVPFFILKFRIPPKSKDSRRNSSLFRRIRRTNRRRPIS